MSFNKLERHASHKWHITPESMTNSDDADREKSMKHLSHMSPRQTWVRTKSALLEESGAHSFYLFLSAHM